ncbi:RNA polymerase sigma factor [Paenirhodobacter sp.]|uniref:RNA polymerase sigma factor n=1 Tax=Paenirhodobacter sp. TaxID=1965326 RepID=UPI003B4229F8
MLESPSPPPGDLRQEIYLSHRAALINYAAPILGSREAAEDVVQEAFLRFAPARLRALAPGQMRAFLYRIVRNLSFDRLKRRGLEQRQAPFWAIPAERPTPEEHLLIRDQIRIVNEVLAGFPPEVRVAVEMHRFGGFTLEEVAAHLGVSVATAQRYVQKALVAVALRLDRRD